LPHLFSGDILAFFFFGDRLWIPCFFRDRLASSFFRGTDLQPFFPGTYLPKKIFRDRLCSLFFQGHTCQRDFFWDRLTKKFFPGTDFGIQYFSGDILGHCVFLGTDLQKNLGDIIAALFYTVTHLPKRFFWRHTYPKKF